VREQNAQNCFLLFLLSPFPAIAVLFLINLVEIEFLRESLGQKRTCRPLVTTSALPQLAEIQQFPVSLFSSWRGLVAKLDLMTGPEPSVPRKFRIAFTKRRAARDSLQRIFAWPAERVLMAHGTPVEKDA
jgi:hypothetical protein